MSEWSSCSKDGYTDNEKTKDISSSDVMAQENSSTDYYQSTDQERFSHSDRSPDLKVKSHRCSKRTPTSASFEEKVRHYEDGAITHRSVLRHKHSLEYICDSRYSNREEQRPSRVDKRDVASNIDLRPSSRSNSVESNRRRRQKHSTLRQQYSNESMPIIEISKNQNDDVPFINSSKENIHKRDNLSGFYSENIHPSDKEHPASRHPHDSRISRDSVSSQDSQICRESRFSRESCTSYDSIDMSPVPVPGTSRRKLERQNETCYSSSSSIFSDNKPYHISETAHFEFSDVSPSNPESVHDEIERQKFAQKLPRNMKKGLIANRLSSNSLSPDMALHRSHREKRYM